MNPRVARLLVRLHAPLWQMRYGVEFEALLVEMPPSLGVVCDTILSAAVSRRQLFQAAFLCATASAALLAIVANIPRDHLAKTVVIQARPEKHWFRNRTEPVGWWGPPCTDPRNSNARRVRCA